VSEKELQDIADEVTEDAGRNVDLLQIIERYPDLTEDQANEVLDRVLYA